MKDDLIRLNQLARLKVDSEGFRAWFDSLDTAHRGRVVEVLVFIAVQAGYPARERDAVLERFAVEEVSDESFARLAPAALSELARIIFEGFAIAERAIFARETRESCNHWWHRDLLDPRVMKAILADPNYASTSMRDDETIQK